MTEPEMPQTLDSKRDATIAPRRAGFARSLVAPLVVCAVSLVASGCMLDADDGGSDGGDTDSNRTWQRAELFSDTVDSLALEVDYQTGAEPYTEYPSPTRDGSTWEMTETNLDRLFRKNDATLDIPSSTSDMEEVSPQPEAPFASDEILEIAGSHRDVTSTESDRSFYVVFLDGKFEDDSGTRDDVLGVSIGNTGVLAIFKPVVERAAGDDPYGQTVRRYVEQTTVVHEFGHAAGLVDNGLAMVDDHRDESHGAHCDNQDCVMYWKNQGPDGLSNFVDQYVIGEDDVVFRDQCLADVDAASEGD